MEDLSTLSLDNLTVEELEALTNPTNPTNTTKPAPRKRARGKREHQPQPTGTLKSTTSSESDEDAREIKFNPKEKKIIEAIYNLYSFLSLALMPINIQDSMLFLQQAQSCSEAHVLLGRQHKQYMKFLEKVVATSAYGAMISAHAPLVLGILGNHNMLPTINLFVKPTEGDEKDATQHQASSFFGRPIMG